MGKVEENFRELTLMSGEFVLMFFFIFQVRISLSLRLLVFQLTSRVGKYLMTIITQHKFSVSVYDPLSCPAVQTDHIFERDEVGLPCLFNMGIDSQTQRLGVFFYYFLNVNISVTLRA